MFTIQNLGDVPLHLSGSALVSVSGPAASDFKVSTPPVNPVVGGSSSMFRVRFAPSAAGLRAATVSIASDDPDENPYQFAVQGAGFATGQETLFSDSKTGKDIDFDGTYYELGTQFTSSVAGKITHLRVYSLASETGDHTARIWRNSDEAVIGGPYTWTYGGTTGWIQFDIDDVDIEANTDYTVSVSTGTSPKRNYPNVAGDLLTAGSNGQHLSHPVNAGVFTTTRDGRPTDSFNGGNYLRDVIFVPAGTTPAPTAPHITEVKADTAAGNVTLRWQGDGPQFTVYKSGKVQGPYQAVPVLVERAVEAVRELKPSARGELRSPTSINGTWTAAIFTSSVSAAAMPGSTPAPTTRCSKPRSSSRSSKSGRA